MFLNPYKGRSGSSNMKFLPYFFLFPFLGDNFGLPVSDPDSLSGSADPVESESETLSKAPGTGTLTEPCYAR
jgi:hypothetical protein